MHCVSIDRNPVEQTLDPQEEDYTPILLPRRIDRPNFGFPQFTSTEIKNIATSTTNRENSIIPWSNLSHTFILNQNYIPHNPEPDPIDHLLLTIMNNVKFKATTISTYYNSHDKALLRSNLVDLLLVIKSALNHLEPLAETHDWPPFIPSAYNFKLSDILFKTHTSFQKTNITLLFDAIFAIMQLSSKDLDRPTYIDILSDLSNLINKVITNPDSFIKEVPIWQQGLNRPDSNNPEVKTYLN